MDYTGGLLEPPAAVTSIMPAADMGRQRDASGKEKRPVQVQTTLSSWDGAWDGLSMNVIERLVFLIFSRCPSRIRERSAERLQRPQRL